MKLLIIKSGRNYIRFKDHDYMLVNIDKASVFPMDQINVVKKHAFHIKEHGFEDVSIKKLVLIEEDLEP